MDQLEGDTSHHGSGYATHSVMAENDEICFLFFCCLLDHRCGIADQDLTLIRYAFFLHHFFIGQQG